MCFYLFSLIVATEEEKRNLGTDWFTFSSQTHIAKQRSISGPIVNRVTWVGHQAAPTFEAEAVELAGDVGDVASGAPADAELGDEVADDAVEGLVVSLHGLGPQHVLPQEAPHRLPLLAFPGGHRATLQRHSMQTEGRCGTAAI